MPRLLPLALAFGLIIGACVSEPSPSPSGSISPAESPELPTTQPILSTPTSSEPASICAPLQLGDPIGLVGGHAWPEISGAVLAADQQSVWVHQDSGHPAVLARVDLDGRITQTVSVRDRSPLDWEDIAAAVDSTGQRYLFVADIGDNRRTRPHVEIHRMVEPVFGVGEVSAEVVELVLPHGPRDAEAVIVDSSAAIIVLTKSIGGESDILVARDAAWAPDGSRVALELAGTLSLGLGQAVLAADLAPDGSKVGVRTPGRVLLWAIEPQRSVVEVLVDGQPCRAPAPLDIFGEALALTGDGYLLLGESETPALLVASRRR